MTIIKLEPRPRSETPEIDSSLLAGPISASTLEVYASTWKAYSQYAGSWEMASQPSTLAQWRAYLATTGKSPNTINRMLAAVKSVIREAASQGYLSNETALAFKNVAGVKVLSMKENLKKDSRTRISPAKMRRLCNTPDTSTLLGKMHCALLLTLASSGCRLSEVITLTQGQIQHRDRDVVLVVSGKRTSSPGKHLSRLRHSKLTLYGKTDGQGITPIPPVLLPRSERLYQPVLSKAEIRSGCVDDVINQLNADNLACFHQFSRYRHIGIGRVNTG